MCVFDRKLSEKNVVFFWLETGWNIWRGRVNQNKLTFVVLPTLNWREILIFHFEIGDEVYSSVLFFSFYDVDRLSWECSTKSSFHCCTRAHVVKSKRVYEKEMGFRIGFSDFPESTKEEKGSSLELGEELLSMNNTWTKSHWNCCWGRDATSLFSAFSFYATKDCCDPSPWKRWHSILPSLVLHCRGPLNAFLNFLALRCLSLLQTFLYPSTSPR